MKHPKLLLFFFQSIVGVINCIDLAHEENEVSKLVQEFNDKQIIEVNKLVQANWDYVTNLTTDNAIKKKDEQEKYANFCKSFALKLLNYHSESFQNETLKRIIKKVTNIGDAMLDRSDFNELKDAIMKMERNYATAKVPSYVNAQQLLSLEPEITNIFEESRNPDELKYYWVKWHDLAGKPSKDDFFDYVRLRNKAARANRKSKLIWNFIMREIFEGMF